MSVTTHGYLPVETSEGIGFERSALKDMSLAELTYIAETRNLNTLVSPGVEKDARWKAAYNKLKAARGQA